MRLGSIFVRCPPNFCLGGTTENALILEDKETWMCRLKREVKENSSKNLE
jgi:hypothetical protein